jgi:hypothetical protein
MIIEALILIAGAYAGRHVNISVSPEAQAVAKKLIDIGIAQLPKVASTGKLLASRAISALPQSAQEPAPVLEAEELEVIAQEIEGRKVAADLLVEMSNSKKAPVKK